MSEAKLGGVDYFDDIHSLLFVLQKHQFIFDLNLT
jgi:hypothetical protein